jgi:hypothetical protein
MFFPHGNRRGREGGGEIQIIWRRINFKLARSLTSFVAHLREGGGGGGGGGEQSTVQAGAGLKAGEPRSRNIAPTSTGDFVRQGEEIESSGFAEKDATIDGSRRFAGLHRQLSRKGRFYS